MERAKDDQPEVAEAGTLLTLRRGLRVVQIVAEGKGEASAQSISEALGVKLGTCYQLLRTLQAEGYVERRRGGRYALGPAPIELAGLAQGTLAPPAEVEAILRELHGALDENLYITMRQGSKIVIASHLEGTRTVRVGPLNVGYSDFPHARATTKCFLAYTNPQEVESYLPDRLEAVTPSTITNRREFLEELTRIRQRGYATDNEEFSEGVSCVSSVLIDETGTAVGSMGISVPLDRFKKNYETIVEWALRGGERASRVLGYTGTYPPPA